MCHAVEIICWKVGDVTRTHTKTLAGDTLWLTALSLVNAGCNSKMYNQVELRESKTL